MDQYYSRACGYKLSFPQRKVVAIEFLTIAKLRFMKTMNH